jgi:hypothetical protein
MTTVEKKSTKGRNKAVARSHKPGKKLYIKEYK